MASESMKKEHKWLYQLLQYIHRKPNSDNYYWAHGHTST